MINKITAKEARDNSIKWYEEYLNKEESKEILDEVNKVLDKIHIFSKEGNVFIQVDLSDKNGYAQAIIINYLFELGYKIEREYSDSLKEEFSKKDKYTIQW
jgi:protein-arginine kinase